MNSLVKLQTQLPATLEGLHTFILIGKERLQAHKAKLRAIDKIPEAHAARGAALQDAQDLAGILLDAEAKLGGMLAEIEPQYNMGSSKRTDVESTPRRIATLPPTITKKESHQAQTIAARPEIVEQVKERARVEGRIPTAQEVYREIKTPHVAQNSGENEWYTPPEFIEAARTVMGGIDCDPASSSIANQTVKAGRFYTAEQDGRDKEWGSRVFMNPPYAQPLISEFSKGISSRYESGEVQEACVLVNNATETGWFQGMMALAAAVAFIKSRVRFLDPEGNPGAPLQGQCVLYFGENKERFYNEFSRFGVVLFHVDI